MRHTTMITDAVLYTAYTGEAAMWALPAFFTDSTPAWHSAFIVLCPHFHATTLQVKNAKPFIFAHSFCNQL